MLILFLPPPYTVVNPEFTGQQACEREKSHGGERRRRKKKKAQKKPLCRDRELNPRTLSPELSVLSIRPRSLAHLYELDNAVVVNATISLPNVGLTTY